MWYLLHGNSGKIVGFFLFLAIFCTSLDAHAQDNPIISGFGSAAIDGIKQSGEWANAGRLVFEARLGGLESDRKAFAILYAMNDGTHLFLGLVTEPGLLDSRWLRLSLNNGLEAVEFYFNKQSEQLLQEVPGAGPKRQFEAPNCCRAETDSSPGYDVLEFEYAQARANPSSSLLLKPGTRIELQISLVSCADLPGEGSCWSSAYDVFVTESGQFGVAIRIVGDPITVAQ